jgi:hypothetical protein
VSTKGVKGTLYFDESFHNVAAMIGFSVRRDEVGFPMTDDTKGKRKVSGFGLMLLVLKGESAQSNFFWTFF